MSDLDGTRIALGGVNARKWWEEARCTEASVAIGEILRVSGVSGNRVEVAKADSSSVADGGVGPCPLFIAQTKGRGGGPIGISTRGVITANTTGKPFYTPVYLSQTPGQVTYEETGTRRLIGHVVETGVNGKILFDGSMPPPSSIVHGTVEFTGDLAVEVTLFSLGTNINGATAVATANNLDGTIHVLAVEISGAPTLTIHMSAAYTGTVSYIVILDPTLV